MMEIQYLGILRAILAHGKDYRDRTGVGRRGLWQLTVRSDLTAGFPLLTTKKVFMRGVAEELFWKLSGSTYEPHLAAKGVHIWKEWGNTELGKSLGYDEGELGPTYGHHMRNFGASPLVHGNMGNLDEADRIFDDRGRRWLNAHSDEDGVDQVLKLIEGIMQNPFSTHHVITLWNPKDNSETVLPPCPILEHFKVTEDGELLHFCYQRSCDMFLGVPFNIAASALLTHLVATVCDLKPVLSVHQLGDAHIYQNHFEQVQEQLLRSPMEPPTIEINPRLKGGGFDALMSASWDDITLHNYTCHPPIKAEVAV